MYCSSPQSHWKTPFQVWGTTYKTVDVTAQDPLIQLPRSTDTTKSISSTTTPDTTPSWYNALQHMHAVELQNCHTITTTTTQPFKAPSSKMLAAQNVHSPWQHLSGCVPFHAVKQKTKCLEKSAGGETPAVRNPACTSTFLAHKKGHIGMSTAQPTKATTLNSAAQQPPTYVLQRLSANHKLQQTTSCSRNASKHAPRSNAATPLPTISHLQGSCVTNCQPSRTHPHMCK